MAIQKICEVGNHPFILDAEDIAAYQKFGVEPLPICFPHQHQWRLAFRNDRFLHRRKCDLTGEEIISMYPPDAKYKVYEREAWFSDRWDPLSYGRPFDFNRSFFEQYAELQKEVPRIALVNVGSINSDYCNSCVFNKNCYLIFGGDRNEDSMFGSLPMYCKNCCDCDWTTRLELCYFSAYCKDCYHCQFAFNSKNCSDCAFIENCVACNECILCVNLTNKSYYIENKPYSKEAYFAKKKMLLDGSYKNQRELWLKFLEMRKWRIAKYATIINSENSTGELIFNSKHCQKCYECTASEDCRECWTIFESKDCFNANYIGTKSVLNFNNISCDTAYRAWFSYFTITSSDVEYSECTNCSKHVFGSIGMRHVEHCILNKKYPKEAFHALREKIIAHMKRTGEWGRFFPKHLSTFPYNESTASIFFPLSKNEAVRLGFQWRDEEISPKPQTYEIPDNIKDVPDSLLEETLACEATGRNFKIIPQELKFYRENNIPIPRCHPDQRYRDRLALRNPWQLWKRNCQKCEVSIQSSYAPERPETVYCEKCFLEALY